MSPYSVGVRTDKGSRRSNNEDSYSLPAIALPSEVVAGRGYLVAVADGVGGQAAGEVASQIAVRRLQEAYYNLPFQNVQETLRQSVVEANRAVWETARRRDQTGMATTIVAAVLHQGALTVAHVGDSRAYVISPTAIRGLTRDHTVVGELITSGALTEAEAANHPHRHVISRSLGSKEDVDVTVAQYPLEPDAALLLCTDGLTNQVSEAKIAEVVRTHSPDAAALRLVVLANAAGGIDNVTAVIVRIGSDWKSAAKTTVMQSGLLFAAKRRPLLSLGLALCLVAILTLAIGLGMRSGRSKSATPSKEAPMAVTETPQPAVSTDQTKESERIPPVTSDGTSNSYFPRKAYVKPPEGTYQSKTYLFPRPNEQSAVEGTPPLDLADADNPHRVEVTGDAEKAGKTVRPVYGSDLWYPAIYKDDQGHSFQGYIPCKYLEWVDTGERPPCNQVP